MIEKIELITCAAILEITKTEGSHPLKILGRDGNLYFAKVSDNVGEPQTDLICELICNYFCKCWGLKVPNQKLIRITQNDFDIFIDKQEVPAIYKRRNLDSCILYASESIEDSTEIESYFSGFNKPTYNRFSSPIDFLKIATFDKWIGNRDRKPENPNVIISEVNKKIEFHPIDHSASLSQSQNLKGLKGVHLYIERDKTLFNTNLAKSILNFLPTDVKRNFPSVILDSISKSLTYIDSIFDEVPQEWGFSKKAKSNIKAILSNTERNKEISYSLSK